MTEIDQPQPTDAATPSREADLGRARPRRRVGGRRRRVAVADAGWRCATSGATGSRWSRSSSSLIVVLACLFPSIPARYGEIERLPKTETTYINSPPSSEAWFGTDDLNRDLYSRIFYGGRVSILIGISVALIACTVGTLVGALAGYLGGRLDDILMRITDVFLAFPILVSLLVLSNVLAEVPLVEHDHGRQDVGAVHGRSCCRPSDGWPSPASCAASCCR